MKKITTVAEARKSPAYLLNEEEERMLELMVNQVERKLEVFDGSPIMVMFPSDTAPKLLGHLASLYSDADWTVGIQPQQMKSELVGGGTIVLCFSLVQQNPPGILLRAIESLRGVA